MADKIVPAHPSATVVLLRDTERGLEVLLVRRSKKLSFHGGAWVFPGGRIDEADLVQGSSDVLDGARRAAVRELQEEAGLVADPREMVPVSRWITPEELPKRFDTWFFVAEAPSHDVTVDGSEIREFRWTTPDEALADQRAGAIELPPPTFVTLLAVRRHDRVATALTAMRREDLRRFTPRICMVEGGACSLYEEDAGYTDREPETPGARHRLWIVESGWRYECSGE